MVFPFPNKPDASQKCLCEMRIAIPLETTNKWNSNKKVEARERKLKVVNS